MKISALEVVGKFTGVKFPWGDSNENMQTWFLGQGKKGAVGTHGQCGKVSPAPPEHPSP